MFHFASSSNWVKHIKLSPCFLRLIAIQNISNSPHPIWFLPESPNLFNNLQTLPHPPTMLQHIGLSEPSPYRLQCSPGPSQATHLKTSSYCSTTLALYPMTPFFQILTTTWSPICSFSAILLRPGPSKYLFYKDKAFLISYHVLSVRTARGTW